MQQHVSSERQATPTYVVANTTYGSIRGVHQDGIHKFKGIPYGAPTGGANRFRPPVKPPAWTGVRDALQYFPMSPQATLPDLSELFESWTFTDEMSEDCLGLNIWTPGVDDGVKRPVMVWFHGGGYSWLSASTNRFESSRLSQRGDVVVVTLNHRLNAFGFLYLGELAPEFADSGNVGMLDLVAALEWVRDNIARFGGDPANVTVFGQSGGGAKVSTIMAMPAAQGLFHRAIAQSGSYARYAHLEALTPAKATEQTRALLDAMGIEKARGDLLQSLPIEQFIMGMRKLESSQGAPTFGPVADGRALPEGPWWPRAPEMSAQVPLIIGSTATENTMLIGWRDPATFSLDESEMHRRLAQLMPLDSVNQVVSVFKAGMAGATPSQLFFAITTANSFRRGNWQQAELKAEQSGAPVFLYELDWKTPVGGGKWESPHSLDIPMIFDNIRGSVSMVGDTPDAQLVADQMSAAWIAFARTGNPNCSAIPHWPAYSPSRRSTMVFDVKSEAIDNFRDKERQALDSITVDADTWESMRSGRR